jgi:hypothetical protein
VRVSDRCHKLCTYLWSLENGDTRLHAFHTVRP